MKESVNFIEGHQKASLLIDNTKKLFIMSQEGNANKGGNTARTIFGIFMIVIYVGMGILLLINFFQWESGPVGMAPLGRRNPSDCLWSMAWLSPVQRHRPQYR